MAQQKILNGQVSFVGCRAYRAGSAVNIPNATITTVPLDGESYDSGSMHDNTTNNSRITVPVAGKYLVVGAVDMGSAGSGATQQIRINQNGSLVSINVDITGSTNRGMKITDILDAAAGDYFELAVYQNQGGTATGGIPSGSSETYLCVTQVG